MTFNLTDTNRVPSGGRCLVFVAIGKGPTRYTSKGTLLRMAAEGIDSNVRALIRPSGTALPILGRQAAYNRLTMRGGPGLSAH